MKTYSKTRFIIEIYIMNIFVSSDIHYKYAAEVDDVRYNKSRGHKIGPVQSTKRPKYGDKLTLNKALNTTKILHIMSI